VPQAAGNPIKRFDIDKRIFCADKIDNINYKHVPEALQVQA
jgi:hypothetical protein